jgi:hypothetical protein
MVTTTFTLWVMLSSGISLPPRTITALCDVKAPDGATVTWTVANVDERELRTCWLPEEFPIGLADGEYMLRFSLGTVSSDKDRVTKSPFLFIRVDNGSVTRLKQLTTPAKTADPAAVVDRALHGSRASRSTVHGGLYTLRHQYPVTREGFKRASREIVEAIRAAPSVSSRQMF